MRARQTLLMLYVGRGDSISAGSGMDRVESFIICRGKEKESHFGNSSVESYSHQCKYNRAPEKLEEYDDVLSRKDTPKE